MVIVLFRIALFLPAAEGRPIWELMIGSTRNERIPPQPLAAGAAQALSTSFAPLIWAIWPSSLNSTRPPVPLIGSVPTGGLVVPVVRFQIIGELLDPT